MTHIQHEKATVAMMTRLYCRHHHGGNELCADCASLLEYAHARLDHCPFGDNKNSCRQCPIHCYRSDRAEHMRRVMRYAGPRMMLHHPIYAIRHMLTELRHRRK